jgi:hypothetical protein
MRRWGNEAFLIRDVREGVVRNMGFHVRMAPQKEGEAFVAAEAAL